MSLSAPTIPTGGTFAGNTNGGNITIAVTAGEFLTLGCFGGKSGTAATTATVTDEDGNTWAQRVLLSVTGATRNGPLSIHTCKVGITNAACTISVAYDQATQRCGMICFMQTGEHATPMPAGQFASAQEAGFGPVDVTLPGAPAATSYVLGFAVLHPSAADAIVAGTGFTALPGTDLSLNSGEVYMDGQYRTGSTSTAGGGQTCTNSATAYGAVAIEIAEDAAAAAAGAGVDRGLTSSSIVNSRAIVAGAMRRVGNLFVPDHRIIRPRVLVPGFAF